MKIDTQIFKKLKTLREKFDLEIDKEMVMNWEKDLRTSIVRADLSDNVVIKELIKNLQKEIDDISFSLSWDSELNKPENSQKRRDMFITRKSFEWLVSFFSIPKKKIREIEKKVEEQI